MDTKIVLSKNLGYIWIDNAQDIFFKGYYQFMDSEKTYRGEAALKALSGIRDLSEFAAFLKTIDGLFAIIIQREGKTLFAVDRARSMPLYYEKAGTMLSDSSEALRQELQIPKEGIDIAAGIELYSTRYVSGNDTVYTDIKQLNGGMCGCIFADGAVETATYYYHYAVRGTKNINEIKRTLTDAAEHMMRRILAVVGDRPIVLSMSGGYDSRFVGCMLKRCGAKDVSCYTYGRSDSFEIQQSKKNAEALGFRWQCVEHSDQSVLDILGENGKAYFDYCSEHDYPIYLQNYIAVKTLHESGWIKPGSVFLTGLCGDMPTGQYLLPPNKMSIQEYNAESCTDYLLKTAEQTCSARQPYAEQLRRKMLNRISGLPFAVTDYQTFWSAIDCVSTLDIHSRVFLNMNRVHEFFDYEWLLPYWDVQLLNAWYAVPAELRANQSLYEDWLLYDICAPYGLATKKHLNLVAQSPQIAAVKRTLGAAVQWIALRSGVPLRRKSDINNVAIMEPKLFQFLCYRGKINYRHASATLLLTRYVMEQRYGAEAVRKVCENLVI